MSFRQMYQDPPAERLLLVVLEQPQGYGSEHRHIRATVVRRAVSHTVNPEDPNQIATYYDDKVATGYRVASWVLSKTSGIYVDDMQLRGQIDIGRDKPLNGGRPYGNSIDFRPHCVCRNTARAIDAFYTKREKFLDKEYANQYSNNDNFYVELCKLAEFLKITNTLFYKPGIVHGSLAEANNFNEMRLGAASVRISEMLEPFVRNVPKE